MATFILSYPGSTGIPTGNQAQKALKEWLHLCDCITRVGGRILVLDPPSGRFSPLFRAAHLGALFPQPQDGSGPVFLLAQARDAAEHLGAFLTGAGLRVRPAGFPWGGQADLVTLSSNRFLLTYPKGSREEKAGAAQVRELLPVGAHVLEIELQEGFPCGDTCLSSITSPGGDHVLLVYPAAIANHDVAGLSRFGGNLDVIAVTAEDAQALACSAFAVRGTLLVPAGLSASLRGLLVRRGFPLVELEMNELSALGGGLRGLVNHLPGYVLSDDAPSYGLRREELHRLLATYPDQGGASC